MCSEGYYGLLIPKQTLKSKSDSDSGLAAGNEELGMAILDTHRLSVLTTDRGVA